MVTTKSCNKNRTRETMETKPITSVTKEFSKDMIIYIMYSAICKKMLVNHKNS